MKIFEIVNDWENPKQEISPEEEWHRVKQERFGLQHEYDLLMKDFNLQKSKLASYCDSQWGEEGHWDNEMGKIEIRRRIANDEFPIRSLSSDTMMCFYKMTPNNINAIKKLAKLVNKIKQVKKAIEDNAKEFATILARNKGKHMLDKNPKV